MKIDWLYAPLGTGLSSLGSIIPAPFHRRYRELAAEVMALPRPLVGTPVTGHVSGRYIFLVSVEHSGEPLACAQCDAMSGTADWGLVHDLVVLPHCRTQGVGRFLLTSITQQVRRTAVVQASLQGPYRYLEAHLSPHETSARTLFTACGYSLIESPADHRRHHIYHLPLKGSS